MKRHFLCPAGILLILATFGLAPFALSDPSRPSEVPPGSDRVLTDDGAWSIAPTFQDRARCSAFVYDSGHDRLILFGGGGSLNDTWSFSLTEGSWAPLAVSGTPPSGRQGGAAIYDPVRDRLIVFGGIASERLNDLWQLSLSGTPTWTQLTPAGTPPSPRDGSLAIYDPVRDRMVLFGGSSTAPQNDVFALSLSGAPAWSQLLIVGTPPPARSYGGALYDPVRDRLVLFGGIGASGTLSDTWELAFGLSTWGPVAAAGTPPQGSAPIAFDPPRDRLLTYTASSLWALNFAGTPTWQAVSAVPGPGDRYYHSFTRDPVRDRVILFGGHYPASSDLWQCTLSTPAWTMLDEGKPQLSTSTSCVWSVRDSRRDRMILMLREGSISRIKTLAFDTYLWGAITPTGTPPSDRTGASAIYDPAGDQIVFFGGTTSTGRTDETWALQLAGTPQWVQLFPSGTRPAARTGHAAILDTLGDRMIVAGGTSNSGSMKDVWSLSLSGPLAWSRLFPTGTAPSQVSSTAVYDETGHRMIVTNGASAVAILSLGASPAWSSAPGNGVSIALDPFYDGARHRVIGFEDAILYNPPRHWAFDLGSLAWTELHPSGSLPVGAKDNYPFTLEFDRYHHRLVHFGLRACTGTGFCGASNDTWLWTFGPPAVAVEPIESNLARSALMSVAPSPAFGMQTIAFRIAPDDLPQTLEVYTADGRRVWHASLRGRGTGVQSLVWNGRTTDGRRAPAAVYFARLVTVRGALSRRFVRL